MADSKAIRAGRAFVEFFVDDGALQRGLSIAQKRLSMWGAAVSQMGAQFATLAVARLAAGVLAVTQFATAGNSLANLSEQTGATVEELSALSYVAQRVGGDFETVKQASQGVGQFMQHLRDGGHDAQVAMQLLHLRLEDVANLTLVEKIKKFATALAAMPDPVRRATLATQIFGAAGEQLLPVLNRGGNGIADMMWHAEQIGVVMSEQDAQAAKEFTQAMRDLWAMTTRLVAVVGGAFAPSLQSLVQIIGSILTPLVEWLNENRYLIVLLFATAAASIANNVAWMAAGFALTLLGKAVGVVRMAFMAFNLALWAVKATFLGIWALAGILQAAIWGLFTASTAGSIGTWLWNAALAVWNMLTGAAIVQGLIFVALLAAIVVAIVLLAQNWESIVGWLGDLWTELYDSFMYVFGGIKDAIDAGEIELAFQILWATIKYIWIAGINSINMFFLGLWNDLQGIADALATGIAIKMTQMWFDLRILWVQGVNWLLTIFDTLALGVKITWMGVMAAIKAGWEYLAQIISGGGRQRAMAAADASLLESEREIETVAQEARMQTAARGATAQQETQRLRSEGQGFANRLMELAAIESQKRKLDLAVQQGLADDEIAAAQAELDALIAQAHQAAQDVQGARMGGGASGPGSVPPVSTAPKIGVEGTFSGAGAAALSGSATPADALVANTARAARLLQQLVDQGANGAGLFGA